MTSRHNEPWTPEEVGRLGELAGSGTPVAEIATDIGRTAAERKSPIKSRTSKKGATR
jgi:hypothetical protein